MVTLKFTNFYYLLSLRYEPNRLLSAHFFKFIGEVKKNEMGNPVISFDIRLSPGKAGVDPNAPDWQIVELIDGVVNSAAEIYDNMTKAEAEQISSMWLRKKEEAGL